VEGHRYADDSEPGWYSGAQYARSSDPDISGAHAAAPRPYDSGVQERPSGAFRLPEQRPYSAPADPYGPPDPVSATGSHTRPAEAATPSAYDSGRIPVRGPEFPLVRPAPTAPRPDEAVRQKEPEPIGEPTSLVPPVTLARPKEKVYRTGRPVSSLIVGAVMALLLVPVVRLLLDATFSRTPAPQAVVPAVLLTLGLTLSGVGLFAVTGGPVTRESWLRLPAAYLPVGLLLLLAAGLATS
jgi:hypothetical protein